MPEQPILEIHDLNAYYGDFHVLHDINLTVGDSEIMVILGTSGCGKSTLLKNIIRLYTPRSGSVSLLGREITALEGEELETLLKNIGVMYQYGALLNSMSIGENIGLPLEMHTNMSYESRREIAELKLRQVELIDVYRKYPKELSGGMQKRAAVARAIVMDPEIVFCDEPSAGLDPVTTQGLDKLLLSLRDTLGMSLVVVTHELESIKRIADRVTFLDKGKVLYVGPLEDALDSDIPQIRNFFLKD